MWGTPTITGGRDLYRKLTIGQGCWFNVDCFFDLGASINIGDHVAIGHQVMILTTSHEIGPPEQRAAALETRPVRIESGAWLGARCTILPGVTIGAGAIVAAGAVVSRDVSPNTMVVGIPARAIKSLP
jgi:maltose O-acetyltransferase